MYSGRVASITPKLRETDRVLAQLWQTESADPAQMWYHIDQWAINEGRDHLYNDHIHFNGPLTQATLHQMLNELCPGGGNPSLPNAWPRPDLKEHFLQVVFGSKTAYYIVDTEGYRREVPAANASVPWMSRLRPVQHLTQQELVNIAAGGPLPVVPEECLLRGSGREVYWVKQGHKHLFPSASVFMAHGFDWSEVQVVDQFLVDLIPSGADVF